MKHQLRKNILQKRIKQSLLIKRFKDYRILKRIVKNDVFRDAKNILIYMPIYGEVDITPLFLKFTKNKKFYLPRVISQSKSLDIHEINTLNDLEEGSFNIPEPQKHHNCIDPSKLDLVLMPGVAFALNGHRVGYGHGYFDKMLKKTKCPKIGIAYDFQIVQSIRGELHDVPVDMIITEKRIIKI
jgi:5-formyltetrahydrofolate cyclo-ligase